MTEHFSRHISNFFPLEFNVPLQPCPAPSCNLLTADGRCAGHRRADAQATDRARGSASSRGYGAQHRKRRALVLGAEPLCAACLSLGRVTPATVDDHIVPIKQGGSIDDLSNHQSLCEPCHNVKRAHERQGRTVRVVQGKGLVATDGTK